MLEQGEDMLGGMEVEGAWIVLGTERRPKRLELVSQGESNTSEGPCERV